MKFNLVDRIELLEVGRRIVAIKALSLAEEYLADHFPAFPVLPGVLMIETMVQAAAWLVRLEQDFANSIVVLSCASNVRYGHFVQPGSLFRAEVEAVSIGPAKSQFKAVGHVCEADGESRKAVSARLELRSYRLGDSDKRLAGADAAIVAGLKEQFKLIGGPEALEAAGGARRA